MSNTLTGKKSAVKYINALDSPRILREHGKTVEPHEDFCIKATKNPNEIHSLGLQMWYFKSLTSSY